MAGDVSLDERRAVHAMRVTYFHWGLHGWSAYVLVGLCLAYFGFRKKLPLTLRSALYPLIGDRIYGPIGDLVDLLAVFGGVFGIATSLGLGASQMATGLNVLLGIDPGLLTQVALIAVISVAATLSVVSGVRRGIRRLSEWNIGVSVVLLGCFLLLGPFTWLVQFVATSAAEYLWRALPMGFWIAGGPGETAWQNAWTIFYWGWWISWAPFVGAFIARISRGRTLREFILGVLVVPTGLALVWFGVFGGNAIHLELNAPGGIGTAGIIELVRGGNYEGALLRDDRPDERRRLARLGHVGPGHPPAGDVVHHVIGLRHFGHHHLPEHGRSPPPAALPHRLGAWRGSGGRRAAARRRSPGPADGRDSRRPARERRAAVHDRRAAQVPGARPVAEIELTRRRVHEELEGDLTTRVPKARWRCLRGRGCGRSDRCPPSRFRG